MDPQLNEAFLSVSKGDILNTIYILHSLICHTFNCSKGCICLRKSIPPQDAFIKHGHAFIKVVLILVADSLISHTIVI